MGLLPLNYRRPAYVESLSRMSDDQASIGSESLEGEKTSTSLRPGTSTSNPSGIPPALSFDRIIDGGTCPVSDSPTPPEPAELTCLKPCTTRDFMNYLIYVERSAENLQFFLWYREYIKRFEEAKTCDVALAPEWTPAMEDEAILRLKKEHAEKLRKATKTPAIAIFKGTDFEKGVQPPKAPSLSTDGNPFSTPPMTPGDHNLSSGFGSSNAGSYREQANEAFTAAGIKAPCKRFLVP